MWGLILLISTFLRSVDDWLSFDQGHCNHLLKRMELNFVCDTVCFLLAGTVVDVVDNLEEVEEEDGSEEDESEGDEEDNDEEETDEGNEDEENEEGSDDDDDEEDDSDDE